MKIVITSDIYYPMTNGVAVFAHNLANGLAKSGHEVMVICPSFTGRHHKKKDKKTGVTTVFLKSVRFPFYPDQINKVPEKKQMLGLQLPKFLYRNGIWVALHPGNELKKALDDFCPDVIHNQTAETVALAASSYAKKNDIPMVSTGHAYPDNITGQMRLIKPIKKPVDAALRTYMASFLKHSEYATMPTEVAIDDLVPKRRRRFKVPVEALSNGVDLTCFKPGPAAEKIYKKYKLKKDVPRVIYVGRVDPEKSIERVLVAFEQVVDRMPEAELLIVGDGTAKAALKQIAKDFGIDQKVRFLGKVMLPDLAGVYKTGTVFATASETETQGIVLIEAAASGLPLVAVDAGAVREVCKSRKNGILCPPRDIDAMSKALIKILSDKKLCKKYSKGSLEIAADHDLKKTLERFEEIYRTAIELKTLPDGD